MWKRLSKRGGSCRGVSHAPQHLKGTLLPLAPQCGRCWEAARKAALPKGNTHQLCWSQNHSFSLRCSYSNIRENRTWWPWWPPMQLSGDQSGKQALDYQKLFPDARNLLIGTCAVHVPYSCSLEPLLIIFNANQAAGTRPASEHLPPFPGDPRGRCRSPGPRRPPGGAGEAKELKGGAWEIWC